MVKRLIALGVLAVLVMAAPAAAQQYPPAVNSLTISDTTPCPGQTITIGGRTFAPGSTVNFVLTSGPVTLGSATADAVGVIALQSTIPAAQRADADPVAGDPDGGGQLRRHRHGVGHAAPHRRRHLDPLGPGRPRPRGRRRCDHRDGGQTPQGAQLRQLVT